MTAPAAPLRIWARYGLCPALGVLDGALLALAGSGKILSIEQSSSPPADLPKNCFFDSHVLTPGLLNAHCHLDYSYLAGALPRGQGFVPWLRGMIAHRRLGPAPLAQQVREAISKALKGLASGGACEVWDIDSMSYGRAALAQSSLAFISFKEMIAPTETAWLAFSEQLREEFPGPLSNLGGLSPHSLYTVCDAAIDFAHAAMTVSKLPLAMHLAESPEETALLTRGEGALAEAFAEVGLDPEAIKNDGAQPIRRAGLKGLLGPRLLAIHCNCPEPGDAALLADSRAVVVFCPGAHEFFGYPPYPLEEYRRAGARLALGTDSLASADSLSMHEQARRVAGLAPEIAALDILSLTTGAALGEEPPYGGRGLLREGGTWALWQCPQLPKATNAASIGAAWLDPQTTLFRGSAFDGE